MLEGKKVVPDTDLGMKTMKKVLLSLLALSICLSFTQCKTKEDRANELIKDYMFKNLYDFESYQPIETKIDSAFHTIYNDSSAMYYAYVMLLSDKEKEKIKSEYESIQSSIEIWCDGSYYSSYSYNKCQDCLNEAKENLSKQFFWMSRVETYRDSLIGLADTLTTRFIGWQVTHDFRCKTKGGNPDIGHYVFVMDKDFKNILSKKDKGDDDEKEIKAIIDESLSMTEEERVDIKERLQGLISKVNK